MDCCFRSRKCRGSGCDLMVFSVLEDVRSSKPMRFTNQSETFYGFYYWLSEFLCIIEVVEDNFLHEYVEV